MILEKWERKQSPGAAQFCEELAKGEWDPKHVGKKNKGAKEGYPNNRSTQKGKKGIGVDK